MTDQPTIQPQRARLRPMFGTADGRGRKIACSFSQDEFDRIKAMAEQNGVAFQEMVRRMCRAYKPGK